MADQIRKHRLHEHPITAQNVTQKFITCGWRHQLSDNMSVESAKRLFDSLMNDTAEGLQPWHTRLGNWLIGRGNHNDDN